MANENTALVVRPPQAEPFEPENLGQALELSKELAQATVIPTNLRNKPADVYAILLLGRDLGLSPMQSILGIHCIEGRPSVSAQTAVALVKRSPLCKFFRAIESTPTRATYETWRVGEPEAQRLTYTIEDAARAKLTGKNTWQAHPAAMLRARAAMAIARDVYPDVIGHLYDEDELDEIRDRASQERMVAPPPPKITAPPAPARDTRATAPAQAGPSASDPGSGNYRLAEPGEKPKPGEQVLGRALEAEMARQRREAEEAWLNKDEKQRQAAVERDTREASATRAQHAEEPPPTVDVTEQFDQPPKEPGSLPQGFDDVIQPVDAIGGRMLGAAHRGDMAALQAEAAKIPDLVKSGALTAAERDELRKLYREAVDIAQKVTQK